jgi:hypothetical protein
MAINKPHDEFHTLDMEQGSCPRATIRLPARRN